MKFRLIIDRTKPEEVVATVHEASALTEELERIVSGSEPGVLTGYNPERDELRELPFADIECVTVMDGKTVLIDASGRQYFSRLRLYALEEQLPDYFMRINKSTLANRSCILRFEAPFSGAVDAVFRCGYREYVSRRCFAEIKRRLNAK